MQPKKPMKTKLSGVALRGIIWILVGVGLHLGFTLAGRPLEMRGTGLPWGLVVAGLGAVILAVDLILARRRARRKDEWSEPPV